MKLVPTETSKQVAPKWLWILCGLVGAIIGIASALAVSGGALGGGKVNVGQWSTDPLIGAKAANPWLRARVARVGLLALSKEETLYFDRTTDETGLPLREACTYQLTGVPIEARWWSITIYGKDQFLPRNTDGASSIDATRALPQGSTAWTGTLSAAKPTDGELWLSSKAGDVFSLTLRLYNPATTQPSELAKMNFPKIILQSCNSNPATGGK